MRDTRPCLFLDLDDTILDFRWAEHRALSRAMRSAGIEPTQAVLDRYSEINIAQWQKLELGLITREQVLLERFEILFEELGLEADAAAMRDAYEGNLCDGHRFLPGAEETLRALAGSCRLFLASNGSAAVQEARLASAGIGALFEDIFISELLGFDKPSRAYFEACFARIPLFEPARALMVGDSLSSDIRGGKNAGLLTCWYNPKGISAPPDLRPDHEIRAIPELVGLVERLFPQD